MPKLKLYTPAGTYRDYDGRRATYDDLFAEVNCTSPVLRKVAESFDAGPVRSFWVRLPRGTDPARAEYALHHTIEGTNHRCRHEHDCCGCPSVRVRVERKTRRDLLVRTFVTYNC